MMAPGAFGLAAGMVLLAALRDKPEDAGECNAGNRKMKLLMASQGRCQTQAGGKETARGIEE